MGEALFTENNGYGRPTKMRRSFEHAAAGTAPSALTRSLRHIQPHHWPCGAIVEAVGVDIAVGPGLECQLTVGEDGLNLALESTFPSGKKYISA